MMRKLAKISCAFILTLMFLPTSWASGYAQTKYPIVLVHGLGGWGTIGPIEHMYRIPTALRTDGADVYMPLVSGANSTEVRGEQLLAEVKKILAITGASKVNLIGHSHGAPTARYVASIRPDLVASVTSVAGVNKGTPVADALLRLAPEGTLLGRMQSTIVSGIGLMIDTLAGNRTLPQNGVEAYKSLSTAGSLKFNRAHPQGVPVTDCGEGAYSVNGVQYFSWSGNVTYTNPFDPIDPALALASLAFPAGVKNDGLMGTCASHLGRVIRDDYKLNHTDLANMMFGITNLFEVSPVSLFRQHANRLKNLGL